MVRIGLGSDEEDEFIDSEDGTVQEQQYQMPLMSLSQRKGGMDQESDSQELDSAGEYDSGELDESSSDDDRLAIQRHGPVVGVMEESDEFEDEDEFRDEIFMPNQSLIPYEKDGEDDDALNQSVGLVLPAQLGLDPSRVQVMNSVFFDEEYVDEDGIRRIARIDQQMKDSMDFDGEDVAQDRSFESVGKRAKSRAFTSLVSSSPLVAPASPAVLLRPSASDPSFSLVSAPRQQQQRTVNVAQMVPAADMRLLHEQGCNMKSLPVFLSQNRYSFRVGWSARGAFAYADNGGKADNVVRIDQLSPSAASADFVCKVMRVHKLCFWGNPNGSSAAASNEFVKGMKVNSDEHPQEQNVWKLVDALWGIVEEERDANPHREAVVRRRAVSKWLSEAVQASVEKQLNQSSNSPLGRIRALVSGYRVHEAATLAMQSGFPRLGAMIASGAFTQESKMPLKKQLDEWKNNRLIDEDEVRVLEMLSGGADDVFVGLDWKRRFGVFLWYRFSADRPLGTIVRAFENVFGKLKNYAPPEYMEQNPKEHDTDAKDLCFHLLKAFANPSHSAIEVFRPESYGPGPIDWRLSWMVRWALARLPQRSVDGTARATLHLASEGKVGHALTVRFAEQLEMMGLWHWAVYVLLICPDLAAPSRLVAVKQVVDRNFGLRTLRLHENEEDSDPEAFVATLAEGPFVWLKQVLDEAAALRAKNVPQRKLIPASTKNVLDAASSSLVYEACDSYLQRFGRK